MASSTVVEFPRLKVVETFIADSVVVFEEFGPLDEKAARFFKKAKQLLCCHSMDDTFERSMQTMLLLNTCLPFGNLGVRVTALMRLYKEAFGVAILDDESTVDDVVKYINTSPLLNNTFQVGFTTGFPNNSAVIHLSSDCEYFENINPDGTEKEPENMEKAVEESFGTSGTPSSDKKEGSVRGSNSIWTPPKVSDANAQIDANRLDDLGETTFTERQIPYAAKPKKKKW